MNSTGAVSAFMTVILSLPVDSDSDMTELAIVGVAGGLSICAPGGDWMTPLDLEEFREVAVGSDAEASSILLRALRRFPRQS